MDWIRQTLRNNERRQELIQLRYELTRLGTELSEKTSSLKTKSEEFQKLLSEYGFEADIVMSEIEKLETEQMIERAERWKIPVPNRPYGSYEGKDDDFWKRNDLHGVYYLTNEAKQMIRRQVFEEREMLTKPILSWLALFISIISLIISLLKS